MNCFTARIVPGHQVASGSNQDPRFPGGPIRMQWPHFLERGLDLRSLHPGTLNVSLSPLSYEVLRPRHTFRDVRWHPVEPAEDFSFLDLEVIRRDGPPVKGWVYYPHPDTKPEHEQAPDVLELLLPWMDGLRYRDQLHLQIPSGQLSLMPGHIPSDA
jgi:hypothetical protein